MPNAITPSPGCGCSNPLPDAQQSEDSHELILAPERDFREGESANPGANRRSWFDALYRSAELEWGLTWGQKLVARAVAAMADRRRVDVVFAGAEKVGQAVAEFHGRPFGRKAVIRALQRLVEVGYLELVEAGGGTKSGGLKPSNAYQLGPAAGRISRVPRTQQEPSPKDSADGLPARVILLSPKDSPKYQENVATLVLPGTSQEGASRAPAPATTRAPLPAREAGLPSAPQTAEPGPVVQPSPDAPSDQPQGWGSHQPSAEALAECRAVVERGAARWAAERKAVRDAHPTPGEREFPAILQRLVHNGLLPPPPPVEEQLLAIGLVPARGAWEPPAPRRRPRL